MEGSLSSSSRSRASSVADAYAISFSCQHRVRRLKLATAHDHRHPQVSSMDRWILCFTVLLHRLRRPSSVYCMSRTALSRAGIFWKFSRVVESSSSESPLDASVTCVLLPSQNQYSGLSAASSNRSLFVAWLRPEGSKLRTNKQYNEATST